MSCRAGDAPAPCATSGWDGVGMGGPKTQGWEWGAAELCWDHWPGFGKAAQSFLHLSFPSAAGYQGDVLPHLTSFAGMLSALFPSV